MNIEYVPESNRFRRGIRFKKAGQTIWWDGSLHARGQGRGEGSFSWREGSRVGGMEAMGRCQGDDGFPPPMSARGQDLDARITGGGNDMWVEKGGWVPASARTRGGGGDGLPPPVFTGTGSRREDNGRGNDMWVEKEGWVPASRLHGGRISTRGQREGERHLTPLFG